MELEDAIKVSKILCQAPEERIPMILSVLEKADVSIGGLDELEEWRSFKDQAALVDIQEFKNDLIKEFPEDGDVIKIPVAEFNEFCRKRKLKPTLTKRALAKKGIIREIRDGDKVNYTEAAWKDGKTIRCVVILKNGGAEHGV